MGFKGFLEGKKENKQGGKEGSEAIYKFPLLGIMFAL